LKTDHRMQPHRRIRAWSDSGFVGVFVLATVRIRAAYKVGGNICYRVGVMRPRGVVQTARRGRSRRPRRNTRPEATGYGPDPARRIVRVTHSYERAALQHVGLESDRVEGGRREHACRRREPGRVTHQRVIATESRSSNRALERKR